jgi:lipoprotein-anchoring transpeptidase ErfK/SrfK
MPYTMFFSEDGKAIHGTGWATLRSYMHAYITEHVGSMGCVGLTEDNAETMFAWAPVGTRIVIVEEEPDEE